ncbi:MAG: hypothetical protein ACOYUK_02020 [Patescibacteria group bacterium]
MEGVPMHNLPLFDDQVVVRRFARAIHRANADGWQTFQQSVFNQMEGQLRDFIDCLLVETRNLRPHRQVCRESISLIVASLEPLPLMDRRYLKQIIEWFLFSRTERPKILAEGLAICQSVMPTWYQGYQQHAACVFDDTSGLYHELLAVSWLVVLAISQAYREDPTMVLVNSFD